MFRLGLESLLRQGFTTAISDTDLEEEVEQKIEGTIKVAEEEVKLLENTRDIRRLITELEKKEAETITSESKAQ